MKDLIEGFLANSFDGLEAYERSVIADAVSSNDRFVHAAESLPEIFAAAIKRVVAHYKEHKDPEAAIAAHPIRLNARSYSCS